MKPVSKVTAAGLGGAAATVAVFVAYQFGIDVTAPVGAALATLFGFAAGYIKAP